MGMKDLENYLITYHQNACPKVKIAKLVEIYRNETGHDVVEAVMDGSYIIRQINSELDSVSGGEFQAYVSRLESYVKKFTDLKITPVFYFDGDIVKGKRRCWVERKKQRLREIKDVYSDISNRKPKDQIGNQRNILPVGLYECTILAIKELGYTMIKAEGDADLDMARYARDHNSFAIFSRDTDFVALRGARYYLSAFWEHLRLDEMRTYHFDRDAIAQSLGLEPEYLPLLCSLIHNDWVDGKYLVPLYRKLTGVPTRGEIKPNEKYDLRILLPRLVSFINNDLVNAADQVAEILDRTFNEYEPWSLNLLAQEIVHPDAGPEDLRRELREQVELSLRMLEYSSAPAALAPELPHCPEPDPEAPVLVLARERHETCQFLHATIFALINNRVLNMGTALEDPALPSCSAETALRPLRRRLYGLLLLDDYVEEWYPCARNYGDFCRVMVSPEKFPDAVVQPHPGLIALWTSREDDVVAARWRLLAWALSAHRSADAADALVDALADDLRSMQEREPELVLPTAMLYVLYHSGALGGTGKRQEYLVRLLVRSCILTRTLTESQLRELSLPRYEKLAVHLAALFMSAYTHVTMLNDVLGAPVPVLEAQPAMFFNGKVLHGVLLHDLDLEENIFQIACKDVDVIQGE